MSTTTHDMKQRFQAETGMSNPALDNQAIDGQELSTERSAQLLNSTDKREPASSLEAVANELHAAREARDAHLSTDVPNVFEQGRQQWMAQRDELNQRVDAGQVQLMEAAQAADPQQIEQAQEQLKARMEGAGQEQGNVQTAGRPSLANMLAARRQQHPVQDRLNQSEQEWTPDQEAQRAPASRTAHGLEGYAATEQAEFDSRRENERMHAAYRDNHIGSGQATQGEVEDWWAKHQAEQAQQPKAPNHAEQQRQAREDREWNDRYLRGRGMER